MTTLNTARKIVVCVKCNLTDEEVITRYDTDTNNSTQTVQSITVIRLIIKTFLKIDFRFHSLITTIDINHLITI